MQWICLLLIQSWRLSRNVNCYQICFGVRRFELSIRLQFQHGSLRSCKIIRVGQNHMYTVYKRYFWQGNCQMYGHIWCVYTYTVLTNPNNNAF
jgi:hypothetical protein